MRRICIILCILLGGWALWSSDEVEQSASSDAPFAFDLQSEMFSSSALILPELAHHTMMPVMAQSMRPSNGTRRIGEEQRSALFYLFTPRCGWPDQTISIRYKQLRQIDSSLSDPDHRLIRLGKMII